MTRRKTSFVAAVTAFLFFLSGCAGIKNFQAENLNRSKALSLVIASDLHYLSPEMTDYGERFMAIIEQSDGKVTHYTPEIVQAFVWQILKAPPDAVILSGDLTLNGDEESHRELVELLRPIKKAGIGLFVMPGNHDVDGAAYRFSDDDVTAIDGISSDDFAEIYESMGRQQAFSKDDSSLSYAVRLSEDLWILMIDVNGYAAKGFISAKTLSWVKDQLRKAKKSKATVIGVSHQNLLLHNKRFPFGYQILGADELLELYREYGVKLHFSGHMHMQHIKQLDGITDIVTSCLAVTPNQYGLLDIAPDRSMSYQTIPGDVSAWAAEKGITDENLLRFSDYAMEFFDQTTESQVLDVLGSNKISQEDKEELKDFALDANRRYFSGTLTDLGPGLALWQEKLPDAFFTPYFESMMEEPLRDMNHWSLDPP
jgi:3',5'-cyclic AMP phosphodiesterase CpdA